MNREQKIDFLKGVANGTRSISELIVADHEHKDSFEYDFCSTLELDKLLLLVRKFGEEITAWPEAEKQYLDWLKIDLPLREPRTHSDRKSFWCNQLPGDLFVIRYKDPSKKPLFQLEHGWNQEEHPNVIYPDHNKHFVHYDLSEWKAEVRFDLLSKKELEEMCLELINEIELVNP